MDEFLEVATPFQQMLLIQDEFIIFCIAYPDLFGNLLLSPMVSRGAISIQSINRNVQFVLDTVMNQELLPKVNSPSTDTLQ